MTSDALRAGRRYAYLMTIEALIAAGFALYNDQIKDSSAYLVAISLPFVALVFFLILLRVFPSLIPSDIRAKSLALTLPLVFDSIILMSACLIDPRPQAMIREQPPLVFLRIWEQPGFLAPVFVLQAASLLALGRLELV